MYIRYYLYVLYSPGVKPVLYNRMRRERRKAVQRLLVHVVLYVAVPLAARPVVVVVGARRHRFGLTLLGRGALCIICDVNACITELVHSLRGKSFSH